ncbi:MAG: dTDP-4-dehydrorhamnose reductase [Pseudomonadales bacterium]|nr:dTDP-4-dehydrorhamnose reductase [Pseudomonadales bacterium]
MTDLLKHKILITGAGGQVGRELVDLCEEKQLNYVAYTSSELDITDEKKVFSEIIKQAPSAVINAAAYTAVDKAEIEQEKAYAVNRDGALFLAKACKTADALLLHISTDYVFDGEKKEPYTVDDIPNPTSVYGASKLAGERAIQETWEKHCIIRVSWVFGQYGNNFVKTMLRLAEERDELSIVSDQFGAPTPADEIARVILKVAFKDKLEYGIEHIESTPGVTWYEFAQRIFSESVKIGFLNNSPLLTKINSDQFPTPVKRPANSKLLSMSEPLIEWDLSLIKLLNKFKK